MTFSVPPKRQRAKCIRRILAFTTAAFCVFGPSPALAAKPQLNAAFTVTGFAVNVAPAGTQPGTCSGTTNYCTDANGYISVTYHDYTGATSDCTWNVSVAFGDNTTGQYIYNPPSLTVTHTYLQPGTYTATITSTNGYSASTGTPCTNGSFTVTIEYPAPIATPTETPPPTPPPTQPTFSTQSQPKCGKTPTAFDDQWIDPKTTVLTVHCVEPGLLYQWVKQSSCPTKLRSARATPPAYTLRLPSISSEWVSLCAVKARGGKAVNPTTKDMLSPVYRYAPYVYLAKGEAFFPGSPGRFIHDSALFADEPDPPKGVKRGKSCRDKVLADEHTVSSRRLGGNGASPYTTPALISSYIGEILIRGPFVCHSSNATVSSDSSPAETKKDIHRAEVTGIKLKLEETSDYPGEHDLTHHAPAVFAVFSPGKYVSYWFFYDYNGWRRSYLSELHQGDWEHVRVLLNQFNRAVSIEYYQHYCEADPHAWGDGMTIHRTSDGREQPVVYSAKGGHASYAGAHKHIVVDCTQSPGADQTTRGPEWDTSENIADAKSQPWWGFGGNWGNYIHSTFGQYGPASPGPHNLY